MPEGLRLRETYAGQRVVQPALGLPPVQHDAYGNAVVTPLPPPRPLGDWPAYRGVSAAP